MTLGLYACLLGFAIPYHEPWADEAQAWMLARSLSPWQLIHTYLRYEGAPGLWHLLLWVLIHLHVSYTGMHWVCGAIATAGIAVLLFGSPLPRWLKLTLPFTYFLAFQFAVVARGYVLAPLLLFLVAMLWRRSPMLVAVLLGLLANVSGHTAAIAGGFALLYLIDQRKYVDRAVLWRCAAIFCMFAAFAVFTALPPRDVSFKPESIRGSSMLLDVSLRMLAPLLMVAYALVTPFLWMFLAIALWYRRGFLPLLPIAMFLLFVAKVYTNFWHVGLIIPMLIAIVWITWPKPGEGKRDTEIALQISLAVIVASQLCWTAYAVRYDHLHDYSPDLATARYLAPYVKRGDRIAVTYDNNLGADAFHSVGIAPYFSQKLFMNQATPFWWWSRQDRTEANFLPALRSRPDVVVMTYYDPMHPLALPLHNEKSNLIESYGYKVAATYCASQPQNMRAVSFVCHIVFLRR